MRISLLFDREGGGLPRSTLMLSRALAMRGHHIQICGPCDLNKQLASKAAQCGVEVVNTTRKGILGVPREVRETVVAFAPDVLVSAHRGCDVRTSRLARKLDVAHVAIVRGNPLSRDDMQDTSISFLWLRNWLWRRALSRARRVVCVSEYVAENVIAGLGLAQESIIVIHNSIDLERFPGVPRTGVHQPCTLLAVGRLSPVKNPHLLVRLAEKLAKQGHSIAATWVGSGPLENNIRQQIAALDTVTDLQLLGDVTDIDSVYRQGDVLVHFCTDEGFGLVLAEAQASGLPVVAFAAGSVPEIVKHGTTGLLCEPLDIDEMAQKVVALTEDPGAYSEMSKASIRCARDRFSLSRLAEEYEQALTLATQG